MPANYNRQALMIVTAAVAICIALWISADTVYQSGAWLAGWRLGMLGVAIPPLALAGYALRLRQRRASGDFGAQVRWLNPVLLLAVCFAVFMFLFSLM